MQDSMIKEISDLYPGKAFLTIEEVTELLGCSKKVVYNWSRRNSLKRRPPRICVGRTIRYPKGEFILWLIREQSVKSE
jgi:excisionase family DNA binding protein